MYGRSFSNCVFIRKQYGFPLHIARGYSRSASDIGRQLSAWIPVSLGTHHIQQRSEPAESNWRGVGHHQVLHRVDVCGDSMYVLLSDQPAKDGRSSVVVRKDKRGVGSPQNDARQKSSSSVT